MNQVYNKVSIIIVNYNQPQVTYECLNSLIDCGYKSVETWVVDNGSIPEKRIDTSLFPEVKLIQSEVNLGFAGGNNLALKQAAGEYILLLNNDTEVTEGFIEKMIQPFVDFPNVGIVSPKIIFYHSNQLIQYSGTKSINPYTCSGQTIGYKETDNGQYNSSYKTDLAHGACMMIKREVIDKIGPLYEDYFLYYEEYDYCEKAKRNGFLIYYTGLTHILHKESVSTGKHSPLKAYYMAKNRILFAKRNFPTAKKHISIAYYFILAWPKNIISELLKGRYRNSLALFKGALGLPFK